MRPSEREGLIISLIKEDMRFNRLILGLSRLGVELQNYFVIEILKLVASLLGAPEGRVSDDFIKCYMGYMRGVLDLDPEEPNVYQERASKCYDDLAALVGAQKAVETR